MALSYLPCLILFNYLYLLLMSLLVVTNVTYWHGKYSATNDVWYCS